MKLSKETIGRIEQDAKDYVNRIWAEQTELQKERNTTIEHYINIATAEATRYEQERKELREALEEIEKSLYIGDDLNDKEILHFYVEVVKTIKKEIHKALNNKQ